MPRWGNLLVCGALGASAMAQTATTAPFGTTAFALGSDTAEPAPAGVTMASTTGIIVPLVQSAISKQSAAAAAPTSGVLATLPQLFGPQAPNASYTPATSWTYDEGGGATPASMWSKDPSAQAEFNYIGGAIVLVAAQKYDRGFFNVSMDGVFRGTFDLFNATADGSEPPTAFTFPVTSIAEHRLIVTNYGNDSRIALQDKRTALDIIAYYVDNITVIPATSITSGLPATGTFVPYEGGSSGGSGTPVGAIVGGVVGGIGGLAIIALVVFLCLRKRKQRHRDYVDRRPSYVDDEPSAMISPFTDNSLASPATLSPVGGMPRPGLAQIQHMSEASTISPLMPGISTRDTGSIHTSTAAAETSTVVDSSDDYASFRAEMPAAEAYRTEAIDMAPPSYAQVYSPSETEAASSSSTPLQSPLPIIRQQSSLMSAGSGKGWMPTEE